MTLGEKIWRLRESRDMSQEELAEKLEVSRQTVSNWENDKAVLDAAKLAKLCSVFGVSADDMLNGEEIPSSAAQNRETPKTDKKKSKKQIALIIFAVIALLLIAAAVVGLILSDDKVSFTSTVIFHSGYVWIALLVVGIASLMGIAVAFIKKK